MSTTTINKHTRVQWRLNQPIDQDAVILVISKYEWETSTQRDLNGEEIEHLGASRKFYLDRDGEWVEYEGFQVLPINAQFVIDRLMLYSQPDQAVKVHFEAVRDALVSAGFPPQYPSPNDGPNSSAESHVRYKRVDTYAKVSEPLMPRDERAVNGGPEREDEGW